MSDSGFSGLPPGTRAGETPLPQSIIELKAKIIELRAEIKAERVRQKLEGEILRHNDDGTTVIKTERGEITVQLRGRDIPPPGTKIEIEIPPANPPGEPPRQVIVRPAPAAPVADTTPQTPAPSAREPQPQAPRPDAPPPRLDPQIAQQIVRESTAPPPAQRPAAAAPVRPDDIIRLSPLPPVQVQDIIRPVIETITARLTPLQTPLPAIEENIATTTQPPKEVTPAPQPRAAEALQQLLDNAPVLKAPAETTPRAIFNPTQFENISPALTLPRTEHALLRDNLPHPLPLLTQFTARPVPQAQLDRLPVIARTPVTQLVQYILQANEAAREIPFAILTPPVSLTPADTYFAADAQASLQQVSARPVLIQTAATPAAPQTDVPATLTISPGIPSSAIPSVPAKAETNTLDVRIHTVTPPAVRLSAIDAPPLSTADLQAALKTMTFPNPNTQIPVLPHGHAVSVTGEIIGTTPQNLPVLTFFLPNIDTPLNFTMPAAAPNTPPGTMIQFTPRQGMPSAGTAMPLAPFMPAAFFSDFSWPAMEELNRTLQSVLPQAAQLANTAVNPASPMRLPAAALFFIAAVRSGDLSGWLGEKNIDALRRIGKGDLLSRLTRDLNGLQRTASEPSANEWRATALPLYGDDHINKMMLYYRHDRGHDNDNEESGKRGTRFIFDLNLSRLGDVQIDGLHRGERLDLIVRTTKPFSEQMQQKMRRTYADALAQTALGGELSFQGKADQFVKIEMGKN